MRLPSYLRRPLLRFLAASIVLSGIVGQANAVGIENPLTGSTWFAEDATDDGMLEFAQGGCSAAAAQAAAESGGQVLSVQVVDRGGQTVCVVTVLVPGRDGSRPRRQTITVPQ